MVCVWCVLFSGVRGSLQLEVVGIKNAALPYREGAGRRNSVNGLDFDSKSPIH